MDALNNTKPVTTNTLEGLKVVEVIERIYKSSYHFTIENN